MEEKEIKAAYSQICIEGKVVSGKQLGREMGFPTANQNISEPLGIPHGIYASTVEFDGKCYIAVSNIGTRPTVSGNTVNCESHILDYSGNLYGKELKTTLHAYLRPERKFGSVQELTCQISRDAECAREYFLHLKK